MQILIDIPDIEKFIMDLVIDKRLVVKITPDGTKNVYAAIYYYMELSVAKRLTDLEVHTAENEEYFEKSICKNDK